jgi:hypothetical protein
MPRFVEAVRTASRAGLRPSLRMLNDIHAELIAPDYPIARWRNDLAVDREIRTYFRSISAKVPLLIDLPEIQDLSREYEFRFDGVVAQGLGVTYLISGLAISVETQEAWRGPAVEIDCSGFDSHGDITDTRVSVKHAGSGEWAAAHHEWIRSQIMEDVKNGQELWARRNDLFPHLVFCNSVMNQLIEIDHLDALFRFVLRRLAELNTYCTNWAEGGFMSTQLPFKAVQESGPTLTQYGDERRILCPDGEYRVFSWHCRLSLSKRLHFFPEPANHSITIGYVGPHLRTVNFAR